MALYIARNNLEELFNSTWLYLGLGNLISTTLYFILRAMWRGISGEKTMWFFLSLREQQRPIDNALWSPACSFFMINHCSKHISQILTNWIYTKKITFYTVEIKMYQRVGVHETIPWLMNYLLLVTMILRST